MTGVKGFDVMYQGRCIDTVYYEMNMTCKEVKEDLVEHDHYSTDIEVLPTRIILEEN